MCTAAYRSPSMWALSRGSSLHEAARLWGSEPSGPRVATFRGLQLASHSKTRSKPRSNCTSTREHIHLIEQEIAHYSGISRDTVPLHAGTFACPHMRLGNRSPTQWYPLTSCMIQTLKRTYSVLRLTA